MSNDTRQAKLFDSVTITLSPKDGEPHIWTQETPVQISSSDLLGYWDKYIENEGYRAFIPSTGDIKFQIDSWDKKKQPNQTTFSVNMGDWVEIFDRPKAVVALYGFSLLTEAEILEFV